MIEVFYMTIPKIIYLESPNLLIFVYFLSNRASPWDTMKWLALISMPYECCLRFLDWSSDPWSPRKDRTTAMMVQMTSSKKPPPKKPSRSKTPAKRRANGATSIANSTNRSLPPHPRPHQQERKAIMVQFEEVKAHTAKCDDCDHRNTNGMSRCKLCGWQCCRKCQAIRGGDKTHETVRGPHVPIAENLEAQASPSLVGTVSRLANAGRASSVFADVGRVPLAAHMVADRTPAAAEQDAVSALMRMGSPPPTQSIGRFNAESPVPPSTSRSVRNDDDDDYNRILEDLSDVETVGGDSTITWDSDLDENNEQLEPILEPLGLCRRNPPRASRPDDMRD
ncbi:uncharacterized protein N7477_009648 [Penicillium maclennaniae]|uniref:uncharacterized protein n=1 Tax=Penicillium maclennaniae TaxID=1343394 RepID=UPI00253F9EFB|nr:uncharacterized protein N7477_009648 [Penicillium maclennaniae]KAJ5662032.1 hypothetical protein N7477_009648 [Penicillium maclennaniae]